MTHDQEAYSRYFDNPMRLTDISAAEACAAGYASVHEALGGLDDDIDFEMRAAVQRQFLEALGGCMMAVVSAEYLYPLASFHTIPRIPSVASGRTVVLDLEHPVTVLPMPFKPDLMARGVEWTGVGIVARMADVADLSDGGLKSLHDELGLAPAVAIPLSNNMLEVSRMHEAA